MNHLATIQQENGEKYVMLKSKFYPPGTLPVFDAPWDAASSLPVYRPPPPPAQRPSPTLEAPSFRAPPPYRPPPEPALAAQQRRPSFTGSDSSVSPSNGPPSYHGPPPPPPAQQPRFARQFSVPCDDFIPASAYLRHSEPPPERAVSIQDLTGKRSSVGSVHDLTDAPALPPRRKPRQDDKENMVLHKNWLPIKCVIRLM